MKPTFARIPLQLCAVGAALSLLAGAAMAQARDEKGPPREKDTAKAATTPKPALAASAPGVRLAALVKPGGGLVRNKGVESVTRIDTGVYCIKPQASTGIDPTKVLVQVSVEYYYSRFNEVVVQWGSSGSGCGASRIAVYTLGDFNLNGVYSFSNDVAFSIVVP